MLSYIKGTVIQAKNQVVTVFVEALSVGFDITVARQLVRLNQPIVLHVYFNWNQEQGPSLYGFESASDRAFFICLIECPGVGPKLALAILEQASINQLVGWIQTNDIKALSALKGIGSKKAEQLILYLKNKLDDFIGVHMPITSSRTSVLQQISQVLESLNYSRPEVQQVLGYLGQDIISEMPFDLLLRKALAFLSKKV